MQNRTKLFVAGLIGILLYFILPKWTKIFAFLIPMFTLSYVYSDRNLNFYIIIFSSLLFLLFPSSIFTLSVTSSLELQLFRWIESPISVVMGLVIFVPLVISVVSLVIAVINLVNPSAWASGNVQLDAEKTINTVLKTVIVICMVLIFGLIAGLFGWKIYGLEWLQGVLVKVWNYLIALPKEITDNDVVKEAIGIGNEMPSLQITMSALTNPRVLGLTIGSIYPLLYSITILIIGIFYWITKSNPKPSKEEPNQLERPRQLNLSFLIFILIIWVVAFMFYLSYSIDSFINYANIGFFGIYLTITSGCCIMLTFGVGSPTKNSRSTVFGVLFGVMLLFMFQNMFTQARTLNILTNEYADLTIVQILNNLIFVAPTESLLFHVFPESLVLFVFLRKNVVYTEEELNDKISELNTQIMLSQTTSEIRKEFNQKTEYAKNMKELTNLKIKLAKLVHQKEIGIENTQKTISNQQFIIYLFSVFAFNVIFAVLHWFKSGLTFEVFWASGLGFLYLSSGMIITLIGYKYGWIAAISCHAIHNSIILFLVFLMGVI